MAKQYAATKTAQVIDGDTEVWEVRAVASRPVQVWRSADGTCRCTQCSGPLSAMLTSCPHARAVKRAAGVRWADGETLSHQSPASSALDSGASGEIAHQVVSTSSVPTAVHRAEGGENAPRDGGSAE